MHYLINQVVVEFRDNLSIKRAQNTSTCAWDKQNKIKRINIQSIIWKNKNGESILSMLSVFYASHLINFMMIQ